MSTTAAAPAGVESPQNSFTHRQILTIFAGLMLGMFLAALDQTIVATSIRVIADDLQGLSLQAWATTAYLITATISTPLYGKLSDLYGRKPLFLIAITMFIVGSLLCTIPTSMYELAAYRAVQGLGAGGLFSLALAIIADIVPPRERARYQGYFLAVFGTSSVAGPVVGGFFADQETLFGIDGWRWVFLVNVPIGLLALVVVAKVLNIPHTRRDHRIDWPGALALAIGLVPLLIVAEQGRTWGWDSPRSLAAYGLGVVGLALFVLAERRIGDDALIPLRLFRGSVFSLTSVSGIIIGMGMFGGIAVLPQYLQIVQGATPTEAGLLTLPLVGGIMVASILSGQITSRTGRYKIFPVIGTALMVVGLLLLSRIGVDTPLWEVDIYMAIFGLGLGNCMQTLTLAVQNAVGPRDMGVATASATFFRQMGGTLGTAVFLSILFSTVGDRIAGAFSSIAPTPEFRAALADPAVRSDPANRPVLDAVSGGGLGGNASGVLDDSSFLGQLDPRLARPLLVGFSGSISLVFLVAAGVIAVAFVLMLFLKEIPLRTQSGVDARNAEDRADEAALAAVDQSSNGHATVGSTVDVAPGVAGRIRRSDGVALEGATVTLTDLGGHQIASTTTDADGRYHLDAPQAGTHLVVSAASAYQPRAELIIADVAVVHHDVTLAGSAGVTGRVVLPGHAPERVAVTLIDAAGQVVATTTTGADGAYRFAELVDGRYTVTASGPGLQPVAAGITVPANGQLSQELPMVGHSRLVGVVRSAATGEPLAEALEIAVTTDETTVEWAHR